MSKTKTISKPGKPAIHFKPGGEHKSLGVPAGKPIPESMHEAAREGKYGPKAKKQEIFRENVLTGPKKGKK